MAKVLLICGKICSGKTFYCKKLQQAHRAVLLSCDEIESQIFHHALGENHDSVAEDIKKYLHRKAVDIVFSGSNVILDWGFWTKEERLQVSAYYRSKGVAYKWYYVDVSDEIWTRNILSRNEAVVSGKSDDYYVDDGLLNKLRSLFEVPAPDEMDVWYVNDRL